jgi:hypothetical protein
MPWGWIVGGVVIVSIALAIFLGWFWWEAIFSHPWIK